MKNERARKVYDCAEQVDRWNRHLWLSLIQPRRAAFSAITAREITYA